MKEIRKGNYFFVHEADAFSFWIRKQSEEGLHPVSIGRLYARFKEADIPENRRYQLVLGLSYTALTEAEEKGWKRIECGLTNVKLLYTDDDTLPDLPSGKEQIIKEIEKAGKWKWLSAIAVLGLGYEFIKDFFESLCLGPSLIAMSLTVVVLFILGIAHMLIQSSSDKAALNRLTHSIVLDNNSFQKIYSLNRKFFIIFRLLTALSVVAFIVSAISLAL